MRPKEADQRYLRLYNWFLFVVDLRTMPIMIILPLRSVNVHI